MRVTNKQKKEIFVDLARVSAYQAGIRAGLDKSYANKWSLIAAVRRFAKEVQDNPKKFNVSEDMLQLVESGLKERKTTKSMIVGQSIKKEPDVVDADLTVGSLVDSGSHKSLLLLHKKLDLIGSSKAQLDKVPIAALTTTVGILFDKRQITKGEATEHVTLQAKLPKDLSNEEKMKLILAWRDKHNIDKQEN